MNWYYLYKVAERFYRLAMSPSQVIKKTDFHQWMVYHRELGKMVGINSVGVSSPEEIRDFRYLSDIIRGLTDILGRLPTKEEFFQTWISWHDFKKHMPQTDRIELMNLLELPYVKNIREEMVERGNELERPEMAKAV